MPANRYEFRDKWFIPYPVQDVWEVLARPSTFPTWWKGVYLEAKPLGSEEEPSIGKRTECLAKGWLPYKLRFTVETLRLEPPNIIEFNASGDFRTDSSRWALKEANGGTDVTLEWNPIADKAIIKLLSPLLKPLFRSNHAWTMRRGERQLTEYMASVQKPNVET